MRIVLALLLLVGTAQAADTLGKTAVRTNAKSDVQAQHAGADGTTVGQVSANDTAAGGAGQGGAVVLPAIVRSSLPTYSTNGNLVGLTVDGTGRLWVTSNQLPAALGQTTMAASLPVVLASNHSTIAVSQGAPTGATTARAAPVNIASAGTSTITLAGSLATSTPLKLYSVTLSGATLARCTIRYNNNGSFTNFGDVVLSTTAPSFTFSCPAGFCAVTTGSTGTQALEASCNNFDNAAQDIGGNTSYCISASGC